MSGSWNKIGTFCGKEVPNAILANNTIKIMFNISTDNGEQGGLGFKIMFYLLSVLSEDPSILINLSELNHIEGMRVLYQDLISKVNVEGKSTK